MLTAILISAAVGLGLGAGGMAWLGRDKPDDSAAAVAATADVVTATGGVVAEAEREDVTDAETRATVAAMPAVDLLAGAVVALGDPATTVAAYAYAQCIAGSQGKQEGSAAYGCTDRGRKLDAAVDGLIAKPVEQP